MIYVVLQMYGQYRKDLASFAANQANLEKRRPSVVEYAAYKPGRCADTKRKLQVYSSSLMYSYDG